MKSIRDYSAKTEIIKKWLDTSDAIIIGAGSGLTAAGGINYSDEKLTAKWFPEYARLGFKSISEIMAIFWNVSPKNVLGYYAFWAKHIWNVRYDSEVLKPYADLHKIVDGRDYFVITTNVDRQFTKAGFDDSKTLATQGNYGLFQYLRKDAPFVEKPHLHNINAYYEFTDRAEREKITLFELGVGFNTPVIIRYPFEKMAEKSFDNVRLIRVNMEDASVPRQIRWNSLSVKGDISLLLDAVL